MTYTYTYLSEAKFVGLTRTYSIKTSYDFFFSYNRLLTSIFQRQAITFVFMLLCENDGIAAEALRGYRDVFSAPLGIVPLPDWMTKSLILEVKRANKLPCKNKTKKSSRERPSGAAICQYVRYEMEKALA